MRGKLYEAISRRNFLKGSGTAAVAAAALPAGMVRSLPAEAAVPDTPFPHGLASGDPQTDRVMLWTRLSPEWVEANASPGQAGIRTKPRCKGCKVERTRTGDSKARCKGCKVERSPSSRQKVQFAELVCELRAGPQDALSHAVLDAQDTLEGIQAANAAFESSEALVAIDNSERTVTAEARNDYNIKIDFDLLQADTYYFYRFKYGDQVSPVARTKTLPATNSVGDVKLALVSCSSIPHGYFNAYGALAGRGDSDFDDVDVVLCLGDYIYEYAQGCYPEPENVRTDESGAIEPTQPQSEMISLADYRERHRQYKLDSDLQALHRKFPMINVWDDHESADNSYPHGAVNHTGPGEGDGTGNECNESGGGLEEGVWNYTPNGAASENFLPPSGGEQAGRFDFARQAYFEYLPIRREDPNDPYRLHRVFKFGQLADLIMLDTRLRREGPDGAVGKAYGAEASSATAFDEINNESRFLMGADQEAWLAEQLENSTAKWQVLGQQIMVGQLRVIPFDKPLGFPSGELGGIPGVGASGIFDAEGYIFLTDIWDGWQASRNRLYEMIKNRNTMADEAGSTIESNVVILTGDIHTSWANDIHPNPAGLTGTPLDLPTGEEYPPYDRALGSNSLAVEFVCPSITSMGLPELDPLSELVKSVNPHVQYLDLAKHGFVIVDIAEGEAKSTWHYVMNPIEQPDPDYVLETAPPVYTVAAKSAEDDGRHLKPRLCVGDVPPEACGATQGLIDELGDIIPGA